MFDLMPFDRTSRSLSNYFDNFEKTFFNDFPATFSQFRTDILDKGDKFVLQAELPGFKKEDIHIDLNNETLTISATHNEETEEKKENFIRRERQYGSFARSFDVSGIDISRISAAYTDGVLELDLPKAMPKTDASRQIEIR